MPVLELRSQHVISVIPEARTPQRDIRRVIADFSAAPA